jgi:membrane fusion protein, multidrug efflux system
MSLRQVPPRNRRGAAFFLEVSVQRLGVCRSLLAAGVAVMLLSACSREEAPRPQRGRSDGPRVEAVQVAIAERGQVTRRIAVTGTLEPLRVVGVLSQLAGPLTAVNAEEGDVVRRGQVLARIAVPELDAQLRSADVAYETAAAQIARLRQLLDAGVITAPEFEQARSAMAAAAATRDQLRTRLAFAAVESPIDGVVLERRVERGDLASPQLRLFTVADVSTLVVRVPVSELDVTALRVGGPADVVLDALPGAPLTGTIRRIFPAADTTTRLVPVEIAITGTAARQARPGFLARVSFRLVPRNDVLLVPATAVLENPRGAVVYVVQDGKASLRSVERGITSEGRVEITEGLVEGDSVVVAGNTMLRDGAAVRVIDRAQPTAPQGDSATRTVPGAVGNGSRAPAQAPAATAARGRQ